MINIAQGFAAAYRYDGLSESQKIREVRPSWLQIITGSFIRAEPLLHLTPDQERKQAGWAARPLVCSIFGGLQRRTVNRQARLEPRRADA